jgi:lysophospholipid acyltransferase (LPLAT)-like uncharacterized protein
MYTTTAKATSSLLYTYLRSIGSTLRVAVALPDGQIFAEADDPLGRFIDAQQQVGPAIFPLWTIDQINLLSVGFSSRSFALFARRFEYFVDDSFGGVLMRAVVTKLGAPVIAISDRDAAARLRRLRSVISSRPSAFLVVDGRGPYFKVGTGIVNLASTMRATVVPCVAASWPYLTLRGTVARVHLPLPKSRVLLSFGQPTTFDTWQAGAGAPQEAMVLQQSLLSLFSNARKACHMSSPVRSKGEHIRSCAKTN